MKAERSFDDLKDTPNTVAIQSLFDRLQQKYGQAKLMEEKVSALLDSLREKDPQKTDKLMDETAAIIRNDVIAKMYFEINAMTSMLKTASTALHGVEQMTELDAVLNSVRQTANAIDLYLSASEKI